MKKITSFTAIVLLASSCTKISDSLNFKEYRITVESPYKTQKFITKKEFQENKSLLFKQPDNDLF